MAENPYNGFPGWYRSEQGAVTTYHLRKGIWQLNLICDVCQRSKKVAAHNEDYGNPHTFKTVCQGCHRSIHTRFATPGYLAQRSSSFNEPEQWVLDLSRDPIDLATTSEHFNARCGTGIQPLTDDYRKVYSIVFDCLARGKPVPWAPWPDAALY